MLPFRRAGFTLLELSIVLVIISIILAMGASSGLAVLATARTNATAKKMDAIEKALLAYRAVNDRLPCPASLTIPPDTANYGHEAANPGTCSGGSPSANFGAAGVAEGGVPTVSIGLPDDFAIDGWGNRLRYAVLTSGTIPGSFKSPLCGGITVNDANGSPRSTASVYTLISHGTDKHGAYTPKGVTFSGGSVNAQELTNCHCNSKGAPTTYAPTYVQMHSSTDPTNPLNGFDDLVAFKEQWQMRTQWDASPGIGNIGTSVFIWDQNRIRAVNAGGIIYTIAGRAGLGDGYTGDGGQAACAQLGRGVGMGLDGAGNIYLADEIFHVVRKITPATGIITTIAGNGASGNIGDGGPATDAEFIYPAGLAFDTGGNIYIADTGTHVVRKITATTGIITTIAGNGTAGYSGDGGLATNATFDTPNGLAIDSSGNLYIADTAAYVIRKVTTSTGIITTIAGTGTQGYSGDGGSATSARLMWPINLAIDTRGNLYITDEVADVVREVNALTGNISRVAGNGGNGNSGDGGPAISAQMRGPEGIALDGANNLYIAVVGAPAVRKVSALTAIISTFAGGSSGQTGDGGPATSAELGIPTAVAIR